MAKAVVSRREWFTVSGMAFGLGMLSRFAPLLADEGGRAFPIGACDWSIGKHSDITSMELAAEIGLDGVEVSLGKVENDMHLRMRAKQDEYRSAADKFGVQVASLAIGELNRVPYKSDERGVPWVRDAIDVCREMGCRVILLAFFGQGALKEDGGTLDRQAADTQEVIRRLKDVAPRAEQAGVILGIESTLNAEEHMFLLDAVGSPAVKVYYDTANMHYRGYPLYDEIRWLGRQGAICQFHMKERNCVLGDGEIDYVEVRRCIDEIGYRGWLIIESSIPQGVPIPEAYRENRAVLHALFPQTV